MTIRTNRVELGTFLAGLADLPTESRSAPEESIRLLDELDAGPRKIVELQQSTKLGFPEFANMVKFMTDADLIEFTGTPGEQTVQLTPIGKTLMQA